jgi:hypothetical protein
LLAAATSIATPTLLRHDQSRNAFAPLRAALALAALALFVLCFVKPVHAQAASHADRGPWDIGVWTAGATGAAIGNSFTHEQVWTAGVFAGKTIKRGVSKGWRRFDLEYGVNLVPLFTYWGAATVRGGGFEPFILRFNSTHTVHGAVPFLEFAGGALFTTSNLPPVNGTQSFNFTARAGGGVYLGGRNRKPWEIGLHWYHISNGELASYNPQFNSLQITIGYHWYK